MAKQRIIENILNTNINANIDIGKGSEIINYSINNGKKNINKAFFESFNNFQKMNKRDIFSFIMEMKKFVHTLNMNFLNEVYTLTNTSLKQNSKVNRAQLQFANDLIKVTESFRNIIGMSYGSRFDELTENLIESFYPDNNIKTDYRIPGTKTNIVLALEAGLFGSMMILNIVKPLAELNEFKSEKSLNSLNENLYNIMLSLNETAKSMYEFNNILTESFENQPHVAVKSLIENVQKSISEVTYFTKNNRIQSKLKSIFKSSPSFNSLIETGLSFMGMGIGGICTYNSYGLSEAYIMETDDSGSSKNTKSLIGAMNAKEDKKEYHHSEDDSNSLRKVDEDCDKKSIPEMNKTKCDGDHMKHKCKD